MVPAKDATNFFLLILLTIGPTTSFPRGVNLFFNKIEELSLNLNEHPSKLKFLKEVRTIILFNFVFFFIQLFGDVFWTLVFTKSPT
jgi:hypothetical protein